MLLTIRYLLIICCVWLLLGGCFAGGDEMAFEEAEEGKETVQMLAENVKLDKVPALTKNTALTLRWSRLDPDEVFGDQYLVQIAQDSIFLNVVRESPVSATAYSISPPLSADGTYYARVKVDVPGMQASMWSNVITFVLDKTAPTVRIIEPLLLKHAFESKKKSSVGGAGFENVFRFPLVNFDSQDANSTNTNSNDNSDLTATKLPTEVTKSPRVVVGGTALTFKWEVEDAHVDTTKVILFEFSHDQDTWETIKRVELTSGLTGAFEWTPAKISDVVYFKITYVDLAGNIRILTNEQPLAQYYDVTSVAPETTLLSQPDTYPDKDVSTYKFTVDPPDDTCIDEDGEVCFPTLFEYRLKPDAEYKRIELDSNNQIVFNDLDGDNYIFSLRAVGLNEAVDATPAEVEFFVDFAPPAFSTGYRPVVRNMTTGSIGYTNTPDVSIIFGNNFASNFAAFCLSESETITPNDSCWTSYTNQQAGQLTLSDVSFPTKLVYLALKDQANNMSEVLAAQVLIDVEPPEPMDIQLADIDAAPLRTTYTNNLSLKIKGLASSCGEGVKYVFVKLVATATAPPPPTMADIKRGNSGPNSKLINCNVQSFQNLSNILQGLVTAGETGPVDLRAFAWTIDRASNISLTSSYTDIQYFTGGSQIAAGEAFDVTLRKVDSDGVLLSTFSDNVPIAFTWVNDVSPVGYPSSVQATASRQFAGGLYSTTGTPFVVYSVARGNIETYQHTVLKSTVTLPGGAVDGLSDAFNLGFGAPTSIKIMDSDKYGGNEVGALSVDQYDEINLFAVVFDSFDNWIENVPAKWSSGRLSGTGDLYIREAHFTILKGVNTTCILKEVGTGVAAKAVYTYTDPSGNEILFTDYTGEITVTAP